MLLNESTEFVPAAGTSRTISEVVFAISRVSGVPYTQIVGCCRDHQTVEARFAVVQIAVEYGRSLTQIGKTVGRDHTTVHHAKVAGTGHIQRQTDRGQRLTKMIREARALLDRDLPINARIEGEPEPVPVVMEIVDKPVFMPARRTGYINESGEIIVTNF
jgi:hypothetical protein